MKSTKTIIKSKNLDPVIIPVTYGYLVCSKIFTWICREKKKWYQGPAQGQTGALKEGLSGSSKKNDLKLKCGFKLTNWVLLDTAFPVCFYVLIFPSLSIFCLLTILRGFSVLAPLPKPLCVFLKHFSVFILIYFLEISSVAEH